MGYRIDFTHTGNASKFLGVGWSAQEDRHIWSIGEESSLFLPSLGCDEDLLLTFELSGCLIPGAMEAQSLEVVLGTTHLANFQVGSRATFQCVLPGHKQTAGTSVELRLLHRSFRRPKDFGLNDARPLAICFYSIKVQTVSEVSEVLRKDRPRIVLVGQSHTDAIRFAYENAQNKEEVLPFQLDFVRVSNYHPWMTVHEAVEYNPVLMRDLQTLLEDSNALCVLSALAGNGHYVHGAVSHPRPFDFCLPEDPGLRLANPAEVIPYDMVRRRVRSDVEPILGLLERISRMTSVPLFHISAPPPVGDEEVITRHIRSAAALLAPAGPRTAEDLDKLGVPPREFRYKLWRVLSDVTKDICRELKVAYIDAPSQTMDSAGYLLPEYQHDGFHGNTAYGAVVLGQIEQLVNARGHSSGRKNE